MSIPQEITREHIIEGIRRMTPDVIAKLHKGTKFDVEFEGIRYPPKEVIRHGRKRLPEPRPTFGKGFNGGDPTNDFLIRRGFKVVDKSGTPVALSSTKPHDTRIPSSAKSFQIKNEDDEASFPEGASAYRLHHHRERDRPFAMRVKRQRLQDKGYLSCDACGFIFLDFYGSHGENYIEAHHTIPVSKIPKGYKTKAADMALVCSNCHRMLHHSKKWLTIAALKNLIATHRKSAKREA